MPADTDRPPLPPRRLMAEVGHKLDDELEFSYLLVGEALKQKIEELLGPEWSWEGRRMLDFGCGSGRLLRQFLDEAEGGEFHGSDISSEMVEWVRGNLCPPLAGAEVNGALPPLSYPDDHFDLVTATSVFTHIADGWSDWLLEMHRVLKPGGTLIATYLDGSVGSTLTALPWDEERVGMSVVSFADPGQKWLNAMHSQWWLREHWGRAFEFVELAPGEDVDHGEGIVCATQGWLCLRARDVELAPADLERERPGDDRYLEARRYQYELLRAEGERLKGAFAPRAREGAAAERLRRARAALRRRLPAARR